MKWTEANPVAGIQRPNVAPRQRYLRPDEIGAFLAAVGSLRSETAKAFVLLCLFTGQRRSCVAAMEWTELDGDRWIIPEHKAKSKRPQVVPLTSHALRIIAAR
jgi:integrase